MENLRASLILHIFVIILRNVQTASRTPTKMGKNRVKYPLLRVKKFPVILYAYYRI